MHNNKLQELAKQFDKSIKEKEDIIQKVCTNKLRTRE